MSCAAFGILIDIVAGNKLTGTQVKVLFAVARFTSRETGWAFPSAAVLAKSIRADRRSAQKVLDELVLQGLLSCKQSQGRHPNEFQLVPPTAAPSSRFNSEARSAVEGQSNREASAAVQLDHQLRKEYGSTAGIASPNSGAGAALKV